MSRDGAKAYLTSYDTLFVLDTASNTMTTKINNPGSIAHTAISADGQRLAIVGLSGFLTMIDTSTDRPIGTAHPLVGDTGLSAPFNSNEQDANTYPGQLALSPDGRIAYVVNVASGAVAVVDTGSGHVIGAVPVGTKPDAIAITLDGRRLLVGAIEGVAVIDTTSNTPLHTIALGPPSGLTRAVAGAKQIAVAPDGARAYVVRDWENGITILDLNATTKLGTITTSTSIEDMTVSPSGRYLYTTTLNEKTKLVFVIDTANTNAVYQIALDHSADGVGFSPKQGRLYVTASVLEKPANTVMVVDTGGRN
jgi:YVTN family beta-propeller protein